MIFGGMGTTSTNGVLMMVRAMLIRMSETTGSLKRLTPTRLQK